VPEVLRDIARREACTVEERGDGFPEGMQLDAGEPEALANIAPVGLGVVRVTEVAKDGREDEGPVSAIGSPALEHLVDVGRDGDSPIGSLRLALLLTKQALSAKTNHGRVDVHRTGVDVFPDHRAGFPNAAAGAGHEPEKIGEVEALHSLVEFCPRKQVLQLLGIERTRAITPL
jgi:hypothetical protein